MNVGAQMIAPEGLAELKKGQHYSFLKNDASTGWVTFVEFTNQKKGRRVHIHRILSNVFVEAVDDRKKMPRLIDAPKQADLPPWLASIDGADLGQLELDRKNKAKTNTSRVEQRFSYIAGLLPRLDEILRSENPFTIINAHAKALHPQQHRTRLAEWFFSYVCFGRQLLALYPEYPNIGSYDKADKKFDSTHFGPVSADKGKSYGWPGAMFSEQIIQSVRKRLFLGNTKINIYIDALREDWGCRSKISSRGEWEPYHPEGKPFPDTYGKFWHQYYKYQDLWATNTALYGEYKMRAKASSKGSYGEEVGTLLSAFEVDAYFLKELPKISGGSGSGTSSRLCVSRGICIASKYGFGIGFSVEGEKASAYKMMLFCTAIGLPAFAELWGIPPRALLPMLPLKGLPPHPISDRGKAPISAIIKDLMVKFPVKEMTETYSGQSKPSVESGHPRDRKIVGPPTYVVSDKDLPQLIQREISLMVLDNHRSNVGDLIFGSRATNEIVTSPYSLASLLDSQGLNDSISTSESVAVRTFLDPVEYEMRDGGVWYNTRCYSSEEIEELKIYEVLNKGQVIKVSGYHMSLNLVWAWVEFRGKLFRLKQKLPVLVGDDEMMLSTQQMQEEIEKKRFLDAEHRRSAVAAEVEAKALFEEHSGVSWGNTQRKAGRTKKNTDAAIEKKVFSSKSKPSGRKVA